MLQTMAIESSRAPFVSATPSRIRDAGVLRWSVIVLALLLMMAPHCQADEPDETRQADPKEMTTMLKQTTSDIPAEAMIPVAPGVWKIRLGEPEAITPVATRETPMDEAGLASLATCAGAPLDAAQINFRTLPRGCVVEIPMDTTEQIYGFGLQFDSHNQTGQKLQLRVNSDPQCNLGNSHAPVPLYVSTAGYAVLVDTARCASFYCGTHEKVKRRAKADDARSEQIAGDTETLYAARQLQMRTMLVDIPAAQGIDIYIFAGPTMLKAVQRYNLFSGGGCLPALWGLGVWYRGYGGANAEDVTRLANYFRASKIPCDVFGLEPGWQSHSYSCSYTWDKGRFPDPQGLIDGMDENGFKLNLWEHVFVHPSSPIYDKLIDHSADYAVWEGLIPDLLVGEARTAFADYHRDELIAKGISGFKLDECDSSDFIAFPWSFPECLSFPSGADGEQMHSLLGNLYRQTLHAPFRELNRRTYGEVRSGHALSAPDPFVLYSDLYDHKTFIRGVVSSGFSGLLWCPEVRQCASAEDLVRRLQSVVFSAQCLVNGWMIKNPPWLQYNVDKNNANELMEDRAELEAICRRLFELRMRLVPYLYAAFARYHTDGTPPFRALVLDYPNDENTWAIDDAWLMGDAMLVAPLVAGQTEREVYLPEGVWCDFQTYERFEGGQKYTIKADLETIPVFVKDGALIPLARPVQSITPETVFELEPLMFGDGNGECVLFEDDGHTFDFEKGAANKVRLIWNRGESPRLERSGDYAGVKYKLLEGKRVSEVVR